MLVAFPAPERCQLCQEAPPSSLLIVRRRYVHVCAGCAATLERCEYVHARHESIKKGTAGQPCRP